MIVIYADMHTMATAPEEFSLIVIFNVLLASGKVSKAEVEA